jgi:hypothetical protein
VRDYGSGISKYVLGKSRSATAEIVSKGHFVELKVRRFDENASYLRIGIKRVNKQVGELMQNKGGINE